LFGLYRAFKEWIRFGADIKKNAIIDGVPDLRIIGDE